MRVRRKKVMPPKGQPPMPPAETFTFPAPIRGLILNENISTPTPGGAKVLDNWTCTTTGTKPRGGTAKHVPLGASVLSMFIYRSGQTETAFGATATSIFNITAAAAVTPAAVVTGRTSGVYSTARFGTPGGEFLYAVNGTDKPLVFDGTTWTPIDAVSTPAITGVTTTTLSNVWSFANRLFFIQKNTLTAWYLPVDSIGGAAQSFSLAGIFKHGGNLLFGATWSLDAGDGLDDKCVFVSDQGEVAVYEGTNPGSAADWRKAGVYNITRPLGPKAIMQAGGDLLIATQSGLVPLSRAISTDVAALELSAVSATIAPIWREKAFSLLGHWEIEKWPSQNIMVVSQPGANERTCLIANLQTGAWSRWTGINVQVLAFFGGFVFFGGADGFVRKFEVGGSDDNVPYTCLLIGAHESMGMGGAQKTVSQMRATFSYSTNISPYVSAQTDYSLIPAAPPNATPDTLVVPLWDSAIWGTDLWSTKRPSGTEIIWRAVGRTGYTIAPEVQITFGGIFKPDIELAAIDVMFHVGAMVT